MRNIKYINNMLLFYLLSFIEPGYKFIYLYIYYNIYLYIYYNIYLTYFYKWHYYINVLFTMNSIKNVAITEEFKDFKTGNKESRHFSCNKPNIHVKNLTIEHYFAVLLLSLIYECYHFSLFSRNPMFTVVRISIIRIRVQDRRSQEIISVSVVIYTV